MRVFKSVQLSPNEIATIRSAIEAEDRPTAQVVEQLARAINAAEARDDLMKTGLVVRGVSTNDVSEFLERMRQRFQVDASRRAVDQQKKKSVLRADAGDLSDDDLIEHFDGWMFERNAVENKGAAISSLSDVAALVGSQVSLLTQWVTNEQVNLMPNYPAIKSLVRALKGDVSAHFKAA